MIIGRLTRQTLLSLVVLLTWSAVGRSPTAAAQSVWGLQPGDTFRVETTVESETTVGDADESPVQHTQLDRWVVAYRIDAIQAGHTELSARILEAGSHVQSDQEKRQIDSDQLSRVSIKIEVSEKGVAEVTEGLDALYALAVAGNPSTFGRLQSMVSSSAVESWLIAPFLYAPPSPGDSPSDDEETPRADSTSWERQNEVSLGPFGLVRSTMTLTPGEEQDGVIPVKLKFNSRHVSPVTEGSDPRQTRLSISAADVVIEQSDGTGVMKQPAGDADTPDNRRPWFQSFRFQLKLSGTARFRSKGLNRKIPFTLMRTQNTELLDFTVRRSLLPVNDLPPAVPPQR